MIHLAADSPAVARIGIRTSLVRRIDGQSIRRENAPIPDRTASAVAEEAPEAAGSPAVLCDAEAIGALPRRHN
jgi:hypothetical protein